MGMEAYLTKLHGRQDSGVQAHPGHKAEPEHVGRKAGCQGVRVQAPGQASLQGHGHHREALRKGHEAPTEPHHALAIRHAALCRLQVGRQDLRRDMLACALFSRLGGKNFGVHQFKLRQALCCADCASIK